MIRLQTYINRGECIAGEVQRLQTHKVIQSVSEMPDLLLKRPREAQRADITCLKGITSVASHT